MPGTRSTEILKPAYIALATAVLPILCINLNYLIAAYRGDVPWCVPYLQGCQTISATSEPPLQNAIYLSFMLPTCLLMLGYWWHTRRWLRELARRPAAIDTWIVSLGLISALGLFVSTAFLRIEGEIHILHRIGTGVFFLTVFIAQLLTTLRVRSLYKIDPDRISSAVVQRKSALSLIQSAVASLSAVLSATGLGTDASENIVEWNFTVLVIAYYFSSYLDWRAEPVACGARDPVTSQT